MAVSGGYAYLVGDGIGLHVIDIANPANPQQVGAIEPDPIANETVVISDGYAYVMDSEGQLQIVDVRDPTRPRRVGANTSFTGFFGEMPSSISIANGKVFATAGFSGLLILHPYQAIRLQQSIQHPSGIGLQISGPPGVPGRFQRSGDLRNWSDWMAVTFSQDPIEITDTLTGTVRFYRVSVP